MKTVLLTNKYTGVPLSIVEAEVPQGFAIHFLSAQTQEALLAEVADADYILAGGRLKITKDVLDRAEKLRMIQRSGVGLDALDLDAIREKGIPLYVNQGVNAESVAEHALLLILACLRRLPTIDRNTKNGIWKKQEQGVRTAELKGKTVGIIGMGNIARTLVGLLKPFQVNILYYDVFRMSADFEAENHMTFVGMDQLLAQNLSDLTDSTQIYIEKAFSKFLRIPSEERPVELINEKQNIILGLKIIDQYNKFWYIKSSNLTNEIPNLNNNNEDKIEGIQIITFSDTFSKITFGYNVLTFYMAFVLLVGNYLRSIFLGSAERVIYTEMVLPHKLLNVCEGIRISRIKKDYLKEEQLYYLLIDLMRSPEIIKNITKSSLIFIQEKNIINQKDSKNDIESTPIQEDFNSVVRKSFNRE